MARGLTYADAVRLLGGGESRIVTALDRLTGGLLLAATGGGSTFALSLFDAKGELFRHGHDLVRELVARKRGLGRTDRTELLAAAQRVLVVTAFFEVVAEVDLPFDVRELRIGKAEQVAMAGGDPSAAPLLVQGLTGTDVPLITPARPYERLLGDVMLFHRKLSRELVRFLSGLAVWDQLSTTDQNRLTDTLLDSVPRAATRRFEEHLQRLAGEFPELGFWVDRVDHQATRAEILEIRTGLAGLQRFLDEMAARQIPDDRRAALSRHYRARLARPLSESGDAPAGMVIPTLQGAYVNPSYRKEFALQADKLTSESWWEEVVPVRDDLQETLIGHLTAPDATRAPLLLLGQPGSGKSVLTQVLAGRLPANDFMVVRVVLRETPADADLQGQIEYAVRDATGETMSWPELARTAGGALPVVILDGFDELLQATGVNQSDYLQQVVRFQERESDQGRPVAFIVTSRTAVADCARIPPGGVVAIRLEPFSDGQVGQWLNTWNTSNSAYLASRGLRPLPAATALAHDALARQPLLLLMLALYDADTNALQNDDATLDLAELYERLLYRFAGREVGKTQRGLGERAFTEAVDEELLRLSITAFAMFNRGRQWTTEQELTDDLAALFPDRPGRPDAGFKARITPGQAVIGRFFFIHQSQALTQETRLSTYEFLHATFGEFLVARLVVRELTELARATLARSRHVVVDDAFLRALISYAPLTVREPIVDFLAQLLSRAPDEIRRAMGDFVLGCFHTALEPHDGHSAYRPVRQTVTAHHAVYMANTLFLTTVIKGSVTGHELFPGEPDPVGPWWSRARLMQSQLPRSGWASLIGAIRVNRIRAAHGTRDVRLSSPAPTLTLEHFSASWTFNHRPDITNFAFPGVDEMRASAQFVCDETEDVLLHALAPMNRESYVGYDFDTTTFVKVGDDRYVSITHALLNLWNRRPDAHDGDNGSLVEAYETCFNFVGEYFVLYALLRQLAAEAPLLPREWRARVVERFATEIKDAKHLYPWARKAFYDIDVDFLNEDES
ncbi:NACHT domain-containing protein [Actinomadura litoris]|uniref:NACHT domain-containing protein n=1 Tax=Actinomadura litoris TaxID=2678616 RepID=UPI001FA777CE|nr:AAA family ATPase [Actinomadura litoris]